MPPVLNHVVDLPARGRSASDVAELLRRAIVAGTLAPNERLIELTLARQFETNRAVVRAALAQLEQQRLIVREPNRGVHVRAYTAEEAAEILETRASLEGLVARRAAQRFDEAAGQKLRGLLDAMHACRTNADFLGYSKLNGQFHRTILEIGHHETASMLLSVLQSQAVRYQFRTVLEPGRIGHSLAEHEAIYAALVARDEDAAEQAMHAHIRAVAQTVRSIGNGDAEQHQAM